jgi:hypothetical protein
VDAFVFDCSKGEFIDPDSFITTSDAEEGDTDSDGDADKRD